MLGGVRCVCVCASLDLSVRFSCACNIRSEWETFIHVAFHTFRPWTYGYGVLENFFNAGFYSFSATRLASALALRSVRPLSALAADETFETIQTKDMPLIHILAKTQSRSYSLPHHYRHYCCYCSAVERIHTHTHATHRSARFSRSLRILGRTGVSSLCGTLAVYTKILFTADYLLARARSHAHSSKTLARPHRSVLGSPAHSAHTGLSADFNVSSSQPD